MLDWLVAFPTGVDFAGLLQERLRMTSQWQQEPEKQKSICTCTFELPRHHQVVAFTLCSICQTSREQCPPRPGGPATWFDIFIRLPTNTTALSPTTNLDGFKFDDGPNPYRSTSSSQQSTIAGGYRAIPRTYSLPCSLPNRGNRDTLSGRLYQEAKS